LPASDTNGEPAPPPAGASGPAPPPAGGSEPAPPASEPVPSAAGADSSGPGAAGPGAASPGAGWSVSRTRDHLANERTYLAWLRTAANVMVLGLAIARLIGHGGPRAIWAGSILVAVGAAGLAYGAIRYQRVSVEIDRSTRVTGIGVRGPMIAAGVLIAAVALALALLTAG
jgi:inner membrane protein YidH